jgi:PadR family transcriptional regulator, regulatory protein PadR
VGTEYVADLKPQIIAAAVAGRNAAAAAAAAQWRSSRMNTGVFAAFDLIYNVIHMKPFPIGPIVGEFEQLVLLALVRLGNGAFGAAIHREIVSRTSREIAVSAVYVTLERLERKRMVCSYIGTSTKQRGGRRRKHYLLDTAGQRAVVRAYRTFGAMTAGLQQALDDLALRILPGSVGARATSRRLSW